MPRNRREPRPTGPDRDSRPTPGASAGGVYAGLLTRDEVRALRAAGEGTLRDEIAMLRVLVRRELEAGATSEQIRKLIREIGQALKVERSVAASEGEAIQLALDDLLEEMGEK